MSAVPVVSHFLEPMLFSPAVFSAGQFVTDGESLRVQPRATVRQIVAENPRLARVFEKYGLSYCCCGGNQSLVELCAERGISIETILADLRAAVSSTDAELVDETDWYDSSLSEHVRHMLGRHHAYLHAELPRLSFLLERVTSRHGELYPELWELQSVFAEFRDLLEKHLEREEGTLFPLLMRLEDEAAPSQGVARLIAELRQDHIALTDGLARMHCSTSGFESPHTACNTYRVLMESLREMGVELCRHLTQEETILFPRAIALIKKAV